jgi:transcription antitermination factor NusG
LQGSLLKKAKNNMQIDFCEDAWYALTVKSRHEKKVDTLFKLECLDSFLPLYCCRHKWADRYKTVELPLFPGYVFCRTSAATMRTVLNTPGVVDFVRLGIFPEPIPDAEIEALRRLERSHLTADPWPSLLVAQPVSIIDGPLAGLSGSLVQFKNAWRLVLSVALLQRSVLVQIDRDWVAPAAPYQEVNHAFSMC